MKKIFLLFGIAAFCSASAQQKDVFDIQKHLDKMFKDKKQGGVIEPFNKSTPDTNYFFSQNNQKSSYTLPNGDKVYILSQDNMPCVVPVYIQNVMPNISDPDKYFESPLFKNDFPGAIPNVVKPYRVIFSK